MQSSQGYSVFIDELKVFIGVQLTSGYASVTRRRLFWEESPDTCNKAISSAIRQNQFEEIMRCIHFANNALLDKNDKFVKLRPLINLPRKKCTEFCI